MPAPIQRPPDDERLSARVEAFSDLVFGFSLSLLAVRLDLPPTAREILTTARFAPFAATFAVICILWLEHYRVFRLGFVARTFDVIANFVFLFAVASLPYALQAFVRFNREVISIQLYLGDLGLIFLTLATLQFRALLFGKHEVEEEFRLRVWRRVVTKSLFSFAAVLVILALRFDLLSALRVGELLAPMIIAVVVISRLLARGLPKAMQRSSQSIHVSERTMGSEGIEPPTNTV